MICDSLSKLQRRRIEGKGATGQTIWCEENGDALSRQPRQVENELSKCGKVRSGVVAAGVATSFVTARSVESHASVVASSRASRDAFVHGSVAEAANIKSE